MEFLVPAPLDRNMSLSPPQQWITNHSTTPDSACLSFTWEVKVQDLVGANKQTTIPTPDTEGYCTPSAHTDDEQLPFPGPAGLLTALPRRVLTTKETNPVMAGSRGAEFKPAAESSGPVC